MATRPIDEKLVVMKLENEDFKRKAAETTGIFAKLKNVFSKSGDTNLNKVTKDLNDVQRSANKVDMGNMASAVDKVSSRFSNLGVVATTALVNISNKATNAALSMMDSLSSQQVRAGFAEYETKIGSIQTILANTQSKGTTLDQVNASLEELNKYADQTIYSFGEMTKNIGLFTNAGLGLEESTSMIKGFSNAAAASGTNAEGAARAAYQLSQGLSSGYLMQMDWMSLTNAGMGNDNMKRDLISLGQAMGTLNVDTETAVTKWKELLSDEQWLTSDVMSTYLQAMAGDMDKATLMAVGLTEAQADLLLQNAKTGEESATYVRTWTGFIGGLQEAIGSGWSETWQLIFGDFEQATVFWTAVSEKVGSFFAKQGEARNDFIRALIDSGAIGAFGSIMRNTFTPILQLFQSLTSAFKSIFKPAEEKDLSGITNFLESIATATEKFKMSAETVENLKTVFKGLFSVVSIIGQAFKIALGSILGLVPGVGSVNGGFLEYLATLAEVPIKLNEYLKSSNLASKATEKLRAIFEGIGSIFKPIGSLFSDFASGLKQMFQILSSGSFSEGFYEESSVTAQSMLVLGDAFGMFGEVVRSIDFGAIADGIAGFFNGVGNTFGWVVDKVQGFIEFFNNLGTTVKENQGWILAGGGLAAMAAIIWKVYEVVRTVLNSFGDIADAIGSFAEAIEGAAGVIEGIEKALTAFTLNIHAKSLLTIAIAVGVLAASLWLLSRLDGKQISITLGAIVGALSALVGALYIINKADLAPNLGAIAGIVALAASLALISGALVKMSELEPGQAVQGALAVIAVLGALSGAVVLMGKYGSAFATSAPQLLAIGIALGLIVFSLERLMVLKWGEIGKGLTAISGIFVVLGAFLKIASSQSATLNASAIGLVAIAGSIWIIAKAIEHLGGLDSEVLKKGLITVGLAMLLLSVFTNTTNSADLAATGAGILMISAALAALVIPIAALGSMPIPQLAKGMTALIVLMGALAVFAKGMTSTIPAAIAIGILAGALNLLVIPIIALGQLELPQILKGILALALGLAAVGGVAVLLGVATVPLIGFGLAIGAIGLGIKGMGAGFESLAKGLILLSTLSVASVTVIISAMAAFITGFTTLIPAIADLIMKVWNSILEVMVNMAPKIADSLGRLILAILTKLQEHAPKILTEFYKLVNKILDVMTENLPKIQDKVYDLLIAMLEVVTGVVPDIIEVFHDMIIEIMTTLGASANEFAKTGADIIVSFLEGMSDEIPRVIKALSEAAIDIVEGMTENIEKNGPRFTGAVLELMGETLRVVVEAGLMMATALFGWIPGVEEAAADIGKAANDYIDKNFKASALGDEKGSDFASALEGKKGDASVAGINLGNSAKTGAGSISFDGIGRSAVSGFVSGLRDSIGVGNVISAAASLANRAYTAMRNALDVNSPSKKTMSLGYSAVEGLQIALASGIKSVSNASATLASSVVEGISDGLATSDKLIDNSVSVTSEKIASLSSNMVASTKRPSVMEELFNLKPKTTTTTKKKTTTATTKRKTTTATTRRSTTRATTRRNSSSSTKKKKTTTTTTKKKTKRDIYNARIETLEYKYEMGFIDINKYLSTLKTLRKEYAKYPDIVRDASRKIKSVNDEIAANREAQYQKTFNNRKAGIEGLKYYNKLSLKQELETWQRMQTYYKKGTAEREEADREVYRLKNEINRKLLDINEEFVNRSKEVNERMVEDIKAANDAYDQEVESRKDSLINFAGIFDKIDKESKKDITGKGLLDNLKGQVETFAQWSNNISILSSKSIDPELLKTLREMGPSAAAEIAALNTLTDTELKEYSDTWKSKNALAAHESLIQLEGLRKDTDKTIKEITEDASKELASYKKEWTDAIREIRFGTEDEYVELGTSMKKLGGNAIDELIKGMGSMSPDLTKKAGDLANDIIKTIENTLQISTGKKVQPAVEEAVDNAFGGLKDEIKITVPIKGIITSLDQSALDTTRVGISAGVVDTSYTNAIMNAIKAGPISKQSSQQSSSEKHPYDEFLKTVASMASQPQVTQVILDGKVLTEVVNANQYQSTKISALTKGVMV